MIVEIEDLSPALESLRELEAEIDGYDTQGETVEASIAQVDRWLIELRTVGASRSLAVAMESMCPGVLPQRYSAKTFTQHPGKTNLSVAMEAADTAGKGLLAVVIGVIAGIVIKLGRWLVDVLKRRYGQQAMADQALNVHTATLSYTQELQQTTGIDLALVYTKLNNDPAFTAVEKRWTELLDDLFVKPNLADNISQLESLFHPVVAEITADAELYLAAVADARKGVYGAVDLSKIIPADSSPLFRQYVDAVPYVRVGRLGNEAGGLLTRVDDAWNVLEDRDRKVSGDIKSLTAAIERIGPVVARTRAAKNQVLYDADVAALDHLVEEFDKIQRQPRYDYAANVTTPVRQAGALLKEKFEIAVKVNSNLTYVTNALNRFISLIHRVDVELIKLADQAAKETGNLDAIRAAKARIKKEYGL